MFAEQDVFDAFEHGAGLTAVRAGPDTQVQIRMWQIESIEKNTRHLVVVMLPGVHQDLLMSLSEHATDRCRLDELRPRTDNRHNSQTVSRLAPVCDRLRLRAEIATAGIMLCRVRHRSDAASSGHRGSLQST